MRARFIGDPNDNGSGPDTITVFGVEFVKGEWRDVTDDRFGRHSHFEFETAPVAPRGRRARTEEEGA
jgi:hypothetical protein